MWKQWKSSYKHHVITCNYPFVYGSEVKAYVKKLSVKNPI